MAEARLQRTREAYREEWRFDGKSYLIGLATATLIALLAMAASVAVLG